MTKFTDLERLAMRQALLLAEKGLYTTGENPRVGACLIKDGNLIAQDSIVPLAVRMLRLK